MSMTKKTIFALVAVVLAFLILETVARIVETTIIPSSPRDRRADGWQTALFRSFLDWHESDPDLLWRFRAGLDNPLIRTNSQHLLGDEIPPEKAPAEFRILLLGDSSPVGLGLKSRKQAFGEILKAILEPELLGNRTVRLINAAVSGYTSEQIALFFELKGRTLDPDLVIVYCGNNDASVSGVAGDRELLAGQHLKSVRKTLSHLALYRLLRGIFASPAQPDSLDAAALSVRVSPERFGHNLNRLAESCRQLSCPMIVIKPPVPVLWPAGLQFRLFTHLTDEQNQLIFPRPMARILGRPIKYCLHQGLFEHIYGHGDIFTRNVFGSAYTDSLAPDEAVAYYREQLIIQPDDPVTMNNLGVSFWQAGDRDSADYYLKTARAAWATEWKTPNEPAVAAAGSPLLYNTGINLLGPIDSPETLTLDTTAACYLYLDSALQADFFSLRIKREYYRQIDSLGTTDMVTVIDLPAHFARAGGETLFIDHCHPTFEGHLLIARILKDIILGRVISRP